MLAGVNYAQLLFPDFSLILIGYLVCRYTALNRSVWQPVEGLVYYFLFPTLLFYSIIRSPIDWHGTSNLMLAGIGTGDGIARRFAQAFGEQLWCERARVQRGQTAGIAVRQFNPPQQGIGRGPACGEIVPPGRRARTPCRLAQLVEAELT